jgi:hypothetical protein
MLFHNTNSENIYSYILNKKIDQFQEHKSYYTYEKRGQIKLEYIVYKPANRPTAQSDLELCSIYDLIHGH